MKKRPSTLSVKDQALLPPPAARGPGVTPSGEHRAVSYLPGGSPRKEPKDIPRLFIRGLGGSIKMDLGGVGVRPSDAVFAHWVADDSLRPVHIFRGDILLIEPVIRSLQEGHLLLLELDGRTVLRRAVKKKRLWCIESVDDAAATAVLAGHALQGVVLGVVRLFTDLQPVKFRGTEPNFRTGLELPPTEIVKATRARPKGSQRPECPYLPTAERKDPLYLVESDKKSRYKARPNKR